MTSMTNLLALAACGLIALPGLAPAATYKVRPFANVAKVGNFTPVALSDNAVAVGTFSYVTGPQGSLAIEATHNEGITADHCGLQGVADRTELTAATPYSFTTFVAGQCLLSATGFVYDVAHNVTAQVAYPNALVTNVYGVNGGGLVAGRYYDQSSVRHGFYLQGSTYISFDPPGSVETDPLGMSPANTVFGTYLGGDLSYHGFLFDEFFNTIVVDYPGATGTQVNGLNGINQAVGSVTLPGSPIEKAFFWQNGAFTILPLAEAVGSEAFALNENGVVTGNFADEANTQHGFVWKPSTGQVLIINAPGGGKNMVITAINNHAQVLGYYQKGKKSVGFVATCSGSGCF
jgi:hypothetical protein